MSEDNTIRFGKGRPESQTPQLRGGEQNPGHIEILFDAERGSLLVGLGGRELLVPQFIARAESQGYTPKSELHMTVIGSQQGKLLKSVIESQPGLAIAIADLAGNTDWGIRSTGERYFLAKQYDGEDLPRRSIIEMVSSPGLEGFIGQVNTLTGLQLGVQPPHVTLATQGNPRGIGLTTTQDLLDFGRRAD